MSKLKNILLSTAAWFARILPDQVKQTLYRILPLAALIRRGLNRAAPEGLSEVTVAAGGLEGARLLLDLQSEKDYWLGTYEPELVAAIRVYIQPGWVAYDVGANIGYVTLLLARAVGMEGQVIAFEALPSNQNRWRENITRNPEGESAMLVPRAVTGAVGTAEFFVHASGGMGKAAGSAGREAKYQETITVPGVDLDSFVFQGGHPIPQVVKMDIEGGEVMALPGMKRLLTEAKPILFLELHGQEAARTVWETLTSAGYSLYRMAPGYAPISDLEELDWKAYVVAVAGQPAMVH